METHDRKYHQAAITYLVYGIIYLIGAIYIAEVGVGGRTMRGGGLVWFAVGALFVAVFPWLIWKGYKWFTRVLALLVVFRIVGLGKVIVEEAARPVPMPGGWTLPMGVGAAMFLLVAVVTCLMLARAGWNLNPWRREKA